VNDALTDAVHWTSAFPHLLNELVRRYPRNGEIEAMSRTRPHRAMRVPAIFYVYLAAVLAMTLFALSHIHQL
jgi:hypothetical protein